MTIAAQPEDPSRATAPTTGDHHPRRRARRSRTVLAQSVHGFAEVIRREERTRIARELHDDLGQRLAAARYALAGARRSLLRSESENLPERLAEAERLLAGSGAAVRRAIENLRPPRVDELGLIAACERLCRDTQRTADLGVSLCVQGSEAPGAERSMVVYRVLQEALTNVVRHAGATVVNVEIYLEAGRIEMSVRDDGRGLGRAANALRPSFGLRGMSERAGTVGGHVLVRGGQQGGTQVRLIIPAVAACTAAETTSARQNVPITSTPPLVTPTQGASRAPASGVLDASPTAAPTMPAPMPSSAAAPRLPNRTKLRFSRVCRPSKSREGEHWSRADPPHCSSSSEPAASESTRKPTESPATAMPSPPLTQAHTGTRLDSPGGGAGGSGAGAGARAGATTGAGGGDGSGTGSSSSAGMATIRVSAFGPISTVVDQGSRPGAVAVTTCVPGSTAKATPSGTERSSSATVSEASSGASSLSRDSLASSARASSVAVCACLSRPS